MAMSARKYALAIFIVAVAVRLTAFWVLPEPHMPYNAIFAYVKGAEILLHGQGFWDPSFPVYTPPLYSMLIAVGSMVLGDGIHTIKLLQVFVDAFTAVILCLLARRVFDDLTGVLAGMLWSLYPFAIYSTLYVGTEVFFTFFVALFLLFLVYGLRTDSAYSYGGAGFSLGLATMIRGTTQFSSFHFAVRSTTSEKR